VQSRRGGAGVDGQTLAKVERYGVDRFLEEIGSVLRAKRYRPEVVLRRYVPKRDGRKRPLGIPTVRDRVVQTAAKLVLEPVFEADFLPVSYGFRPKRSATAALETLRKLGAKGHHDVRAPAGPDGACDTYRLISPGRAGELEQIPRPTT
jgi:retron-type reverse transcriptase